jgi:hypothetical protein
MRTLGLALLGLVVGGCGNNAFDNGFAVDLVLQLDPSVAGAASSIRTLEVDASGADTTTQTMVPTALPSGSPEHLIYRPNANSGTIMFSSTARDATGADVAFGQGSVELRSGATTTLTITLGGSLPPAPDFGFVPADMMVPNAPMVTPATATLPRLGTQDFSATAPVTWSVVEANGGSVDAAGHYTAPGLVGTYHVKAALVDDANVTATVAVTVVFSKIDVIAGAPGGQGAVDGTGVNARFGGGEGMLSIDASGNIYLPDRSNQTLRRITSAGVVTTIVGQVGRTPPMADINSQLLNDPLATAVNAAGTTVYVSECSNHTVSSIVFDSIGNTWTKKVIAGQPGVAGHADAAIGVNALLNCPTGLALDETNSILYANEFGEHDVRKIALSGTNAISTLVGVPGTCGAQDSDSASDPPTFCNPYGLAFDGSATLFVADSGNATVRKVVIANPLTGTTTIAGTAGMRGTTSALLSRPMAVVYQNSSSLFVTDQSSSGAGGQMVRQVNPTTPAGLVTIAGVAGTSGYHDGAGNVALFNQLSGMALLGSTGYVWDDGNFVVRTVGLTGSFTVATLTGTPPQSGTALQNGTGSASRFNQPVSIAVDKSGAAYVADRSNCAVRKIVVASSAGTYSATVSTLAGGGVDGKSCGAMNGAGATALFGAPQSLLFDGQHTLYVAESSVRSVDLSSGTATVATTFTTPTQSRGVALDRSGVFYVTLADQTISRYDPVTAELLRLWGQQNTGGASDGFGEMATFSGPAALLLDGAKELLYVADANNRTLRRITPAENYVSTVAGSATASGAFIDGVGTAAKLGNTGSMAFLPDGRIVFVDTGANALRMFDPSSEQVTTLAGVLGVPGVKSGALPGGVSAPYGVAMLPTGELLISDIGEQVVQIVY